MNYLEVNLTECVWDIYPKNYKISLRDLKRPKCMQSHATFVTKPILDPITQHAAKPLFWPRVVMKKSAFYCKVNQGEWAAQLMLKRHKLPHSFQGRDFTDSVGRGVTGCAQFSDGLLVKCRESQSSTIQFQTVWRLHADGQLAVNFFHLRINLRPCLRVFPAALEGEPWLWLLLFFLAWLLAFVSAFSHFSD